MASEDDYESLPPYATPTECMIAGAAAGIMEHCFIYPVDVVKTRMQCLYPSPKAEYKGVVDALVRIVREEGAFRPVRGIGIVAFGAGPAHALYFSCYEFMKRKLTAAGETPGDNPMANLVAGCFSTLLHDAVMVPADMIKQRVQMYESPYKGMFDCIRKVAATEGIGAFYRSYFTQLSMNIPFQCTHLLTYDYMQSLINPTREYNPISHSISGAVAGAFAAALTTPMDVCKTFINVQECCDERHPCPEKAAKVKAISVEKNLPPRAKTLRQAIRIIYHTEGVMAFYKGIVPRMIYQIPGTAVSWSVFEFFKFYLKSRRPEQGKSDEIA